MQSSSIPEAQRRLDAMDERIDDIAAKFSSVANHENICRHRWRIAVVLHSLSSYYTFIFTIKIKFYSVLLPFAIHLLRVHRAPLYTITFVRRKFSACSLILTGIHSLYIALPRTLHFILFISCFFFVSSSYDSIPFVMFFFLSLHLHWLLKLKKRTKRLRKYILFILHQLYSDAPFAPCLFAFLL